MCSRPPQGRVSVAARGVDRDSWNAPPSTSSSACFLRTQGATSVNDTAVSVFDLRPSEKLRFPYARRFAMPPILSESTHGSFSGTGRQHLASCLRRSLRLGVGGVQGVFRRDRPGCFAGGCVTTEDAAARGTRSALAAAIDSRHKSDNLNATLCTVVREVPSHA